MIAELLWIALPLLGQEVIAVWPEGAPGSEGRRNEPEKKTGAGDYERVTNVHNPTLTLYPAKRGGAFSIVICPGGGHRHLAVEHEGRNVARMFEGMNVNAYVLKYRLARAENSPYSVEKHALADLQQAIRLVRQRSIGGKVAVMGFSAGGQLAALAAARFEDAATRPDLQILIYPGMLEGIVYPPNAPPAFLLWAADDPIPAAAIGSVFEPLRKAGVPVELHVYARGGHGFGIKPGAASLVARDWFVRFGEWLQDMTMTRKY
ncbi:MAG: alpha/beta hydrolase fold domain-containing protein [Bryobacter sp.]|jgi:endo-1,4-beta-xylanase|nr:alpha/beta hydrolase fold domain-containing protein [Bryobacter sp. CoA8 C33]